MTKEQIIEKVKENLKSLDIDYDKEIGIDCRDKEEMWDRDDTTKELYVISFRYPDKILERNEKGEITDLIEGFYCFGYIDANTYEILYYSYPHGYIEVDGSK